MEFGSVTLKINNQHTLTFEPLFDEVPYVMKNLGT